MRTYADSDDLPDDWWTVHDVCAFLGIKPSTFRGYVKRDQCPRPERVFGRSNAWRPATIREWARQRPRKGEG